MASNLDQRLFRCTGCDEELDFKSKTLPCLHSFCGQCLDKNLESKTSNNGQCPECREPLIIDQLSLSPVLGKSLRRRQLESGFLKCDLCVEDGLESVARNWCYDCQTLFCVNCSRWHKKLQRKHNARDFDGMEKGEIAEMIMTDTCYLHEKLKDCYCKPCNMCFCDCCYENHVTESAECSSQPLSVGEEALKQKSQGSTLTKEMDDIEMNLQTVNEKTRKFIEELNIDCDSKCRELWSTFEEMVENAKQKTEKLCHEMQQIKNEQVEKWRDLIKENENILKQLEIWRLNLHHLLRESQQDVDVVCGLGSLETKLSSQLDKSVQPEEMCQLKITFPNFWPLFLERIKRINIGSVSWEGGTLSAKNLNKLPATKNLGRYKKWNIDRAMLSISSMVVTEGDNYVFVGDKNNKSIIGFTEAGEFFCECVLSMQGKAYTPADMCLISSDVLAVCCQEDYIFLLERRKIVPFLKIKQVVPRQKSILSVCQLNDTLIGCNQKMGIFSFTKEGKYIEMIREGFENAFDFRIRSNPLTGNIWGCANSGGVNEIYCCNSYGEKIISMTIKTRVEDFCIDELGQFYFCTRSGIFSLNPLKKLYSLESAEDKLRGIRFGRLPIEKQLFALNKKIFVSVNNNGQWSIQIFDIFD